MENIKLLPIVAFNAFERQYPNLNKYEALFYYPEQCAVKEMWGIKSTIKFI